MDESKCEHHEVDGQNSAASLEHRGQHPGERQWLGRAVGARGQQEVSPKTQCILAKWLKGSFQDHTRIPEGGVGLLEPAHPAQRRLQTYR